MKKKISLSVVILLSILYLPVLMAQTIFQLDGVVTDISQQPIYEAWIDIYSEGIPNSYQSSVDGQYGGWNLWADEIDIVCSKEGYHPVSITVHPTTEENTIDFRLIEIASSASPTPFPTVSPSPTPAPSPPAGIMPIGRILDYNGDGRADIAIFRPSAGLWAVRELTKFYFGGPGDIPISADYTGDGTAEFALFKRNSGLWAIRDLSRVYFGSSSDTAVPGDYDADGCQDVGIFRAAVGLWAVRGVTRIYFGTSDDIPD